MSFRQIFDRIARLARSEMRSSPSSDFERELRRAEELIEESRGPRRTTVDDDSSSTMQRPSSSSELTPEYVRACRTLGIATTATRAEIAAAYRARARQFHPDRVSNSSAEEQRAALVIMQELNLAYEYLERSTR
ncbi:MAG: DnaJ domain-containing protein [bacterium]|nr:DnaJ domain-containing protein [Candidatus Kapabacteria bacterium]